MALCGLRLLCKLDGCLDDLELSFFRESSADVDPSIDYSREALERGMELLRDSFAPIVPMYYANAEYGYDELINSETKGAPHEVEVLLKLVDGLPAMLANGIAILTQLDQIVGQAFDMFRALLSSEVAPP